MISTHITWLPRICILSYHVRLAHPQKRCFMVLHHQTFFKFFCKPMEFTTKNHPAPDVFLCYLLPFQRFFFRFLFGVFPGLDPASNVVYDWRINLTKTPRFHVMNVQKKSWKLHPQKIARWFTATRLAAMEKFLLIFLRWAKIETRGIPMGINDKPMAKLKGGLGPTLRDSIVDVGQSGMVQVWSGPLFLFTSYRQVDDTT